MVHDFIIWHDGLTFDGTLLDITRSFSQALPKVISQSPDAYLYMVILKADQVKTWIYPDGNFVLIHWFIMNDKVYRGGFVAYSWII